MSPLLWGLLGCLHPALDSLPMEPRVTYAADYTRATRELQVLRTLETQVLIQATLITEELAEAQALTLSRAWLAEPPTYERLKAERVEEARAYWVLVLTSDSPRGTDSLSLDDGADWTLRLEADARPVAGVDLEEIRRPGADEELLYLQLDPWSRLWKARFERPADADQVVLTVAGPLGQGRLTWSLR